MSEAFIHPQALCESQWVGPGTRVWAFAHVLPQARIGQDCNVCDHVFIENDVEIGDRVTVKCGVQLWDGVRIEDDVFIGPNATFTNDRFPRSKAYPAAYAKTVVRAGASIGANATLLPGLTIGAKAMVAAGAVVTRSVPANAIVAGNPAKIIGYVDAPAPTSGASPTGEALQGPLCRQTSVAGVTLHTLRSVTDMRGSLAVGELDADMPFQAKRFFMVHGVPSVEVRGEHAHRQCGQFLVAAAGRLHAVADDGLHREEFILDRPDLGLYVPPMVWCTQYRYSPDAVLLVLASDPYDPEDYVRDYDQFLALVRDRTHGAGGE